MVARCEVGKPWFTEEMCHEFWEQALDRDLVPEVWGPLWTGLPKIPKETKPTDLQVGDAIVIKPDDAYVMALNRSIEIGMCYPRLRTALEREWPVLPGEQVLESHLTDFFKNDHLSDVSLVHPSTGAIYK